MNLDKIKTIPIDQILTEFGIVPTKQCNNALWYHAWTRNESTASVKVDLKQNLFYDFGTGVGGSVIDIAMQLNGFREVSTALKYLESFKSLKDIPNSSIDLPETSIINNEKSGSIIIQVQKLKHPALLSYAQKRKINLNYLIKYCKEVHYRVGDKKYFAIGFENNLGGFELRNSIFKSCTSPKSFTHLKNGNNKLLMFEGFFDFLSLLTCNRKSRIGYDYLILNSISFAEKIDQNTLKNYVDIYLFLDNDSAGVKTNNFFFSQSKKYTNCSILYEQYKDLNEWLIYNNI